MYSTTITVDELRSAGLAADSLAKQGTPNIQRKQAPQGVVTHTPGITFADRALAQARQALGRNPAPAELDRVAAMAFDVLKYQPGYLIGTTGKVYQLDQDHMRTQHSGMLAADCPAGQIYSSAAWREWARPLGGAGWVRHGRDGNRVYDWWNAAFSGEPGPAQIFPWGIYPNNAIGVDILPDPMSGGMFSEAQRASYLILVRALSQAHGFKISARTVTTHSFASPCERGAIMRGGKVIGIHWDPPRNDGWDHQDNLAALGAA
jgi:hypothetical protein